MLKLLGAALLLGGGIAAALQSLLAYRRELATLAQLRNALLYMEEKIRLRLTPLPRLLENLERDCPLPAKLFFAAVRRTMGENFSAAWRAATALLALSDSGEFSALAEQLTGDEESVCKSLRAAAADLERIYEEKKRGRSEREKVITSLCLSGALLLIILLI